MRSIHPSITSKQKDLLDDFLSCLTVQDVRDSQALKHTDLLVLCDAPYVVPCDRLFPSAQKLVYDRSQALYQRIYESTAAVRSIALQAAHGPISNE
jgi:hypothetical protein